MTHKLLQNHKVFGPKNLKRFFSIDIPLDPNWWNVDLKNILTPPKNSPVKNMTTMGGRWVAEPLIQGWIMNQFKPIKINPQNVDEKLNN